ncbi:ABC transporter substrate-binding protein [Microlunatus soli]|uniref:Carbohydrate ABC transporter substrate-binding protein, CUT1 family n=1 Tax=Microlunatus soli TaxID=630515 RepID=A0A1H2AD35_9ACTN|nr:sugar ABC transporter substrate-binding protein [Microlunatus soli]SDT43881.1 carbohydrate ABC transporter substrate-binding protein, CUT1 family [Microlunatus soli]
MRRRSLLGLGGLLAVAGCAGGGADQAATTRRAADWDIPGTDPEAVLNVVGIIDPQTDTINDVIAAFEKAHPRIKINYQYVPFDSLNSVLDSRITSRTGDPDVFWVDQPRVPALAVRGYLTDLTRQFTPLTGALQPSSVRNGIYEDKLYALPLSDSTQLLYYNKEILAEAGIAEPPAALDKPISWQQLRQDARRAQQRAGAQNGLLLGQVNRYYQLEPLPVSAGGGAGGSGPHNLTPAVDNPGWNSAMDFYRSLFSDRISPRGMAPEQVDSTYLAGRTAYLIEGDWMVSKLNDSDLRWGVARHPVWQGGRPATPNGSWSVGINPFSGQKPAAAIFLRWLAVDGKGGYSSYRSAAELPANRKGLTAHLGSEMFTDTASGRQAAKIISYQSAQTSVPRLQTPGYIEFEDIIGRTFADVSNGIAPRRALASAQEQLEAAWQQYR